MAEYTVELRTIIESGIEIFDFNYPFYDETKRAEFQKDFIRHFYFREIGAETVDRFKWYLEDKFATVFPYYNKLFEAAEVEYNLLDHYRLVEKLERVTENESTLDGQNYGTSQFFGNQNVNTKTTSKNTMESTAEASGSDTENENTNTLEDLTSEQNTTTANNTDKSNTKKFLDTPQGLTDIKDSKYLTNVTDDTGRETLNGNEHTSNSSDKETDTERELTRNTTNTQTSNGTTEGEDNGNTETQDEQKSTSHINNKTKSKGTGVEEYTLTREGNIGVATDAEGIEKHVLLRKTLENLKRQFFDECEDLFMLVY